MIMCPFPYKLLGIDYKGSCKFLFEDTNVFPMLPVAFIICLIFYLSFITTLYLSIYSYMYYIYGYI